MSQLQQLSLPISDAFSIFILHCKSQRFSPTTIKWYGFLLEPFISFCSAASVTELSRIGANHIRAYLVERQDNGAAPNYVHGIARALRAFFNFCVAEEWLERSPMKTVVMPKRPRKILPAFDADDLKRIQRADSGERLRALVLFLLDTGIRASELVALNGADVSLVNGTVRIRSGKGDKERIVYIGSRTVKALIRYYMRRGTPAPDGAIWVGDREPHKRLTRSGILQILKKLGKAAGVEHCHPHTFRRTFAITCLRNGMNIFSLQQLMGHEDLDTLRQYLALVQIDAEQAHRQYGVVDNL